MWGRIRHDARAVIVGVLSVFLLGLLATHWSPREMRLLELLRALPSSVFLVVIEDPSPASGSADGIRAREILEQVLPAAGQPVDQHELRPVVTLLLERGGPSPVQEESAALPDTARPQASVLASVRLFDAGEALRAGISGDEIHGFAALGPPDALAVFHDQSARGASVSRDLLRFLRRAKGIRILLRSSWLAREVPVLRSSFGNLSVGESAAFVAAEISGSNSRISIRGMVPGDFSRFGEAAAALLPAIPGGTILALDGLPLHTLLPSELPPVLDALREESGVKEELAALVRAVGNPPTLVLLRGDPRGFQGVVLAVPRELRKTGGDVVERLEALLKRRTELTGARTETVVAGGRRIRHLKPASGPRDLLKSRDGSWNILEAPRSAGMVDLVAAVGEDFYLLGTSKAGVLEVGTALLEERRFSTGDRAVFSLPRRSEPRSSRAEPHFSVRPVEKRGSRRFSLLDGSLLSGSTIARRDRRAPDVALFLDGERLRQFPAVQLLLREIPIRARRWVEQTVELSLEVRAGRSSLTFDVTAWFLSESVRGHVRPVNFSP